MEKIAGAGQIIAALKQSDGVAYRAAQVLGVSLRTFWNAVLEYKVDVAQYRARLVKLHLSAESLHKLHQLAGARNQTEDAVVDSLLAREQL